MAKVVKTIPATINILTKQKINSPLRRRVAGYARVSTDQTDQLTSYEAQLDYYTNYIKSRSDWEFVNVYTDEGITGTSIKKRDGFNKMVEDALDGKIDLIITKSVSRFARNTVDSLTTVRKLKEKGVEIYFEKENIWTLDSKGELLITIMSSLAQEESRSISENVTWGHRRRFEKGRVSFASSTFLGYDLLPDGKIVINHEEAKIVRRIYNDYVNGDSYLTICRNLQKDGIKSPMGNDLWRQETVRSILSNEKYKGDVILQKSFTVDFLTKTKKINEGEVPQYYIEGNHEPIIDPYTWDLVQSFKKRHNNKFHFFTNRVQCKECGEYFSRRVWHSNSKYRKIVWQCRNKTKRKCDCIHKSEKEIYDAFIDKINSYIIKKEKYFENIEMVRDKIFDTNKLEEVLTQKYEDLSKIANEIEGHINVNMKTIQNQEEYQIEYEKLKTKYEKLAKDIEEVKGIIDDKNVRKIKTDYFISFLKKQKNPINEFKPMYWNLLLDKIIVSKEGNVDVRLIG